MFSTTRTGRGLAFCAAFATLLAIAPAAQAADPSKSIVCNKASASAFTQIFNRAPWADPGFYALAPAASMEATMTNWNLSGGAAVVTGNESYFVGSTADKRSIALPSGSSTTSAPMCVGLDYPWMRFFLRNTGAASATLKVESRIVKADGTVTSVLVANLSGTSSWQLSPKVLLVNNLLALFTSNGLTPVSFRFTPVGGSWKIDDLYVDPYRSR